MTPFRGGKVGDNPYPTGKWAWRCAACGRVGPWADGWGGYWSVREEDAGLFADTGPKGFPVWCSPACMGRVIASGATNDAGSLVVTRRRK